MKKIILGLMLVACFFVFADSARCADFKLIIREDIEVGALADSYMQGEPVIIHLTATNPKAMNAHYYNLARGTGEKEVPKVNLGSANEAWINFVKFILTGSAGQVAVNFNANIPEDNVVALDQDTVAENYFFISPEESAKLQPGEYTLKATLSGVESKTIDLTFVAKKELSDKEKLIHHLKLGRYNLLLNRFQEALDYAQKILAIDARNLRGMVLKGDALTGLERYREAYDIFDKSVDRYVELYPPTKDPTEEPPDLILERMMELRKKM